MRRVKRELIPYEEIFDRDNTLPLCVELTEQQIALLLSQTGYLFWAKRYITDTGLPLSDEQREVIEKAASALENVLVSAEGCDMGYTLELVDCELVLKNNGVIVSQVDIAACVSPPIHIGFDVANCRLMYTQGDINSPYAGGDWISVIDWNIENFKQCLLPSQQPPKPELVAAEVCDIAWGAAEQVLRDVLYIQQYVFDATSGAPYTWAIDLIADASFLARQWWGTIGDIASAIGLANWIYLAPVPDQGMLDTYASLEAKTLLATYFYCSMSVVEGDIVFDGAEWISRMNGGFFSVNVRDAVLSYVTANGAGDLLRNYFLFAAINTTGTDCSAMDCYILTECLDYVDDMVGGLGARSRLFDAAHNFLADGSGNPAISQVEAGGGIGLGDAVRCVTNNGGGGGGLWIGGFFVDLGRECDITSASVEWRNNVNAAPRNGSIDIDYYNAAGTLVKNWHAAVNALMDGQWYTHGAGSWADVRYIVYRGASQAVFGESNQISLTNPIVDVT